jgi:sulfur-oxidizing protein SoxY
MNPKPLHRRHLLRATLAGLLPVVPLANAAVGGLPSAAHADSSPEWEKLRAQLFAQRPIDANAGKVQLIVPLRAAYGASVPVKIVSHLPQTEALYVKRLTLLVDKNPSPVAAVIDLTTEVGQADFETRIRVDEYSHIRIISELSNGELHMDSRYVKVSGGCSAPPNRDQLHNLGKTVFRLPTDVKLNEPTAADVQVVHPNDTGFELNNITVMFIPPHFVRSLKVSYGEHKLFDAELDFSISENPAFRFNFVPHGAGELRAEVEDSKEGHFSGSLAVPLGGAMAAQAQ